MSLPRPSIVVRFTRLLASAALLVAGLAAPVSAVPVSAGPPPLCGAGALLVSTGFDNGPGSLRAAVACALNGQTVTFSSSQTGNTIVLGSEIPIAQSITIDGSGAPGVAADGAGASRVFNISANGPVTLTHLIVQHGFAASGNGGALLAGSLLLVLNQVQVLSSTAAAGTGGGLYSGAGAIFTNTLFISNTSQSNAGGAWVNDNALVTGGRFERNTCAGAACQGGGLNVDALTLSGTQFISNSAAGQGGGAWANSAARLTNASLEGNRCTDSACLGGGLYGLATLTLTNTDFISNTATGNGGGAWAAGAALLTNGSFQGNTCSADPCQGGGLLASSSLTFSGTQFSSNKSTAGGGGAWTNGAATLTNGSFQGNACTVDPCPGGGLYVSATLTLSGTQINSNFSHGQGAGAWVGGAAQAAGGHFEDNHCIGGCQGGGLYASADLTLTNTDFINNASAESGGGAFAGGAARVTGGTFQDNHCSTHLACSGGGLHAGALTLTGANFINNASAHDGGGAYANGSASISAASFQGNQCTDSGGSSCSGGGLYARDVLTLTNTDFLTNTSVGNGGGAYVAGDALLTGGHLEGNHCSSAVCAGGGLFAGFALTLSGTQVLSNNSGGDGGGVYATDVAALMGAHFEGNRCRSACTGGGLSANASLTLTSTDFISNTSTGDGGGVAALAAPLTITGGRFERNTCTAPPDCFGGGLSASPTFTLTGALFISNTSTGYGGGLAANSGGVLTNVQFQGNACTSAGCLGGGLWSNGPASVLNSAFSANHAASFGGAIGLTNTAAITLANVTLSGNIATVAGGGLYAGGTSRASLWNLTVADNQAPTGGGLRVEAGATAGVTNTIFSNNTTGNCSGAIAAATHNLQFPAATCGGAGFTTADPLLGPLALNAPGATLTRALLAGSPARDQGDPASCAGPLVNNVDQRGVLRPADGDNVPGAVCDIGSYEAALFLQLFLPLVKKQ